MHEMRDSDERPPHLPHSDVRVVRQDKIVIVIGITITTQDPGSWDIDQLTAPGF
jgi:hypothetical protein